MHCHPARSIVRYPGWCAAPVSVPHVDWRKLVESDPLAYRSTPLAAGYEQLHFPDGVSVYVVEEAAHAADALGRLRSSMEDSVVAIDLEWRPSFGKRQNPVALVQLASATTAVLMRTSRMGFALPQVRRRPAFV